MLPTAALRYDEAVSEFQKSLRLINIHSPEERVSHDPILIQSACLCAARPFVTSRLPRAVRCLCPNVFIAYHLQPRPRIVWPVWSTNGSGWTSGLPERTWHLICKKASNANLGNPSRMTNWALVSDDSEQYHPASSMVGEGGVVAEWLSLDERLIFQSVSQINFMSARDGARARSVGLSRMLTGPCSATNGNFSMLTEILTELM